jgi:uncharacterized delta-60 repeat protein
VSLAIVVLFPAAARAQSAADGFNPAANGAVRAVAALLDGRVIVGGEFTALGGVPRQHIGRINVDGSIDPAFDPNVNGSVRAIAVQSDGRIVIGGDFSAVAGAARPSLARLNTDGSIDASFVVSVAGPVYALAVQPDGKLLVGGAGYVARLHTNGTFDAGFAATVDGAVLAIAVQQNERVVLGGDFTGFLKRVLADGTVDGAFGLSATAPVRALALRVDGTIIAAGDEGLIAGQTGAIPSNGAVHALALQPDGTWVAAGEFTEIGGSARNRIARFGRSGQLDAAFTAGADGPVFALARQSGGSIVTGGAFTHLSREGTAVARASLGRLTASGYIDADFNPGANNTVVAMAVQADGKVLVGGFFTSLGGTRRNYLGRLNPDGSLDASFNPGANDAVLALAVQPDGRILVGGAFTTLGGGGTGHTPRMRLARLNQDGSVDSTFDVEANNQVNAIAVQRDRRIVVGGQFTMLDGVARRRLGRVDAEGVLDLQFDPGVDNLVHTVAIDPDGRIVIGGAFTMLGGGGMGDTDRAFIGRLNADGTLDTTFDPGADGAVHALAFDNAGRILVGGAFTMLGGGGMGAAARSFIGRLHGNGAVDVGFNPVADGDVHAIASEPDGAILIGGAFAHVSSTARYRLARIGADGIVDPTFNPGANNTVFALAHHADGRVLVGGAFTALGGGGTGTPGRAKLGRLTASGGAVQDLRVTGVGRAMAWTRSGAVPEIATATLDVSLDGEMFTTAGIAAWNEGSWELDAAPLPVNQRVLVRARGPYASGHQNGSSSIAESIREVFFAMPSIVATAVPSATIGAPFSAALSTTGAVGVVSFAAGGQLPPGLALSASGVLSGVPQAVGAFPFSLTATDASSGCAASADFILTVGCPAILLSSVSFSTGITGASYTPVLVTASGGTGAVSFAVVAGQLPPGMSLSTTGSIAGTPTQPGTVWFTIRATDANGCFGTRAYAIEVRAAPVVVTQPLSQTVTTGGSVVFVAAATGSPAPTYQWQINAGAGWSNLANGLEFAGVQTTNLTVSNVPPAFEGRQFRVVVSNTAGASMSSAASLTVHVAPSLTMVPASQTVVALSPVTFTVAASGNPVPVYRWQLSTNGGGTWSDLSSSAIHGGVASAALTVVPPDGSYSGYQYRAIAANSVASTASGPVTLTVHTAPVVTSHPAGATVVAGTTVTITAAATGNPPPTYRWQVFQVGGAWADVANGNGYAGATTASLTLANPASSHSGNQYRAVIGNGVGSTTSNAAVLTVHTAPVINTQPVDRTVVAGSSAVFAAAATGNPAPAYRWEVSSTSGATWGEVSNAANYTGASGATLTVSNVDASLSGKWFRVVASNVVGSSASSAAVLSVQTAPAFMSPPGDQITVAGATATFTVLASGAPAPAYRWQVSTNGGSSWADLSNSAVYSGVATTLLVLNGVPAAMSGYAYRAVASNSVGSVASAAGVLTVYTAPTMTTHPVDRVATAGAAVSFSAAVAGTPSPVLRWQVMGPGASSWSNLSDGGVYSGTVSGTLNLSGVTSGLNGSRYRLTATNSVAAVSSSSATLTVNVPPAFSSQPVAQTTNAGQSASFSAQVTGSPTPSVRWQESVSGGASWADVANGGVYAGALSGTLVVSSAILDLDGRRFRAIASNAAGTATSNHATLTVNAVSDPRMMLESPVQGATVDPSFAIWGWAIDAGAPSGVGVDTVQLQVFALNGGVTGGLVRSQNASFGAARPDIGNEYGTRFTNAGFSSSVADLPPGSYRIFVRAQSVVTGTFNSERSADVAIAAPSPQPFMALDAPSAGVNLKRSFDVTGWAVDAGAIAGTGVDAVHVWISPLVHGVAGAATFVGAASLGGARPDIGSALGLQFAPSGFTLRATGIAPGTYRLTVFAHSTVTGTFNQSMSVDITVVPPVSTPAMALDAPANGGSVASPFSVRGWAVDLGADADPGVSNVHVWAFPFQNGAFGAGMFVGVPNYGEPRPDLGAALGSSFANCGFSLNTASLPPGAYRIVAFAFSTIAGAFNQSLAADIVVTSSGDAMLATLSQAAGATPRYGLFVGGREITLSEQPGSTLTAVAHASGRHDVVWLGGAEGDLHVSHEADADEPRWRTAATRGLPASPVTAVAVDSVNTDLVLAGFAGLGELWKTRDGGRTWRSLRVQLPESARDATVRALAIDPLSSGRLYAGTSRGLLVSIDEGETWAAVRAAGGLDVAQLLWKESRLIVVTHTNGVFAADDEHAP